MDSKNSNVDSDFFVVSDAGSPEVNGVYKNLDGNSNDNTLNYKMTNRDGRMFKLYRSPSEDQSVRYWIIEERNKDYYYLAFSDKDIPPEKEWTPYVAGKARPPEVTKVPPEVENELRTRIEHYDSLTTLDLIDQYGKYCPTPTLKKLYRVLWEEQPPETKRAVKAAAQSMGKAKGKRKKTPTIKQKISITVQLGVSPSSVTAAQSIDLTITADTLVHFLIKKISMQLETLPGKHLELMFNGHKILSTKAAINKLGIRKGSIVIALGVKPELPRSKSGNNSGLRKSALPPLDEAEDEPGKPEEASNGESDNGCTLQ